MNWNSKRSRLRRLCSSIFPAVGDALPPIDHKGPGLFSLPDCFLGSLAVLSLTEAMIFVAITPCDETDLCSVGYPPPFCELRVLDTETGEEVATGEVGEIVMKSPSVMKGYFENAYETQAAHTEDGWLRTGDLGYRDPVSGRFFYVGRTKEVILCLDNRLFPSEVERALLEHPAVADAAVIGVPHRIFGEAPTALVELRQGTQPSAALQQELAALIESEYLPLLERLHPT